MKHSNIIGIFAFALALLTPVGCDINNLSQSPRITLLKTCSDETDKEKCNKSKQESDGKECAYNTVTRLCEVKPPSCKDQDEAACQASNICTFDDTKSPKCQDADATVSGKCEAIQVDTACTGTCAWDAATMPKCKTKSAGGAIYTWKKLTLPAGSAANEITNFVVSGDNKHAYAYTNKAGDANKGLWHSADNGATWTRLGVGGDGVISAKVSSLATNSASYDSKAYDLDDLKPTQLGAVVFSYANGVFLLEGAIAKWGIYHDVNHKYRAEDAGANSVSLLENQAIKFVDVVDVNNVENIVFAQINHADTENMVWFKPTNNVDEPIRVQVKKVGGVDLDAPQSWLRAGNGYNGDLLLASNSGVWHVPKNNLIGGGGNRGRLAFDQAILFPEPVAPGVTWLNTNKFILFLGSLENAPGVHQYMAGMKEGDVNENGGLAHYTGAQVANHAALNLFGAARLSVFAYTKYGNMTRIITSQGVKGLNPNGTPKPADDYKFDTFAADKNHMMDGKTAVTLGAAHNAMLGGLYGNDALTWYRIYGVDPAAGIYVREKSIGQARP